MSDERLTPISAAMLQARMVAFVRAFGLHRPDQTPCGQPVSVAEAHALAVFDDLEWPTQQELAARLQLEKSTVSRLVGQLEERGWLERRPSLEDRRAKQLRLTAAGRRARDQLAAARQAKFESLLVAIPEEQRLAVLAALDVLVEAMREHQ